MRISVEKDDTGYSHSVARDINVLLDGLLVDGCITADTNSGYVKRYKKGEDGRFLIDKERQDIVSEEVYGKVEIVPIIEPLNIGVAINSIANLMTTIENIADNADLCNKCKNRNTGYCEDCIVGGAPLHFEENINTGV